MVRNHKIAMMGGGVVAGAAALALAAEALLWSSVHAPNAPDPQSYYLPSSWMLRAVGGGEDAAVVGASFVENPDPAWRRDRGARGDGGRAGPAGH